MLLLCFFTKAQTLIYPDVFSSYSINKAVLTPSYIPVKPKYILSGIYKFKLGNANLSLFDANFSIVSERTNKHKQLFRVSLHNEKEGPYISSPRGYLNYAYLINFSEVSKLSIGVAFGFVSKIFSAPSSTGKGNLTLPDGNIGLTYTYRSFQTHLAIYQLLGSKGKAIKNTLKLKSYYQLYMEKSFDINDAWKIKPQFLLRVLPEVTNQFIGGFSLIYKKQIALSSVYTRYRGVAFQAQIKIDNNYLPFTIGVLYNSSLLSQSPVWVDSMELGYNFSQ